MMVRDQYSKETIVRYVYVSASDCKCLNTILSIR